jgi:hypothetical protein
LFRHLKRVIDFNAKITHRTLRLAMTEKQLDRAQILGPALDQ